MPEGACLVPFAAVDVLRAEKQADALVVSHVSDLAKNWAAGRKSLSGPDQETFAFIHIAVCLAVGVVLFLISRSYALVVSAIVCCIGCLVPLVSGLVLDVLTSWWGHFGRHLLVFRQT